MTIDKLLQDPLISLDERDDESSRYVFRLGELQTPIELILRKPHRGWVAYEISHAIHTPLQGAPNWTSHPRAETREWAMWRALEGLLPDYRAALGQGFKPSEVWLVAWPPKRKRARK